MIETAYRAALEDIVRGDTTLEEMRNVARLTLLAAGYELVDPCDACSGARDGCLWCGDMGSRFVRVSAKKDAR